MLIFQLFSVNHVTTTLLQEILYKLTDHTSYVGQDRLVALLEKIKKTGQSLLPNLS